jgi:aminopeptidase YwaD
MKGGWTILEPGGGSAGPVNQQAQLGARRGAMGLLLPARVPVGGTFFKQPFAGQPFQLPTFFVREELLAGWEGGRLDLRARFRRFPLHGVNIIAELAGSAPPFAQQPVIVGAHYDGVGDDPGGLRFPGASDNAVGVAIVLEAARVLRSEARGWKRPVWCVAFDAEEAGAFGSRALARDLRAKGLRPSVLNVDAAVAPGQPFAIEGSPDARAVFAILDRAGRQLGTPLAPGSVSSDNRPFASEGFTSVGIGVGGQGFHTPHDKVNRIDCAGLRSAGELLLETVRELAS